MLAIASSSLGTATFGSAASAGSGPSSTAIASASATGVSIRRIPAPSAFRLTLWRPFCAFPRLLYPCPAVAMTLPLRWRSRQRGFPPASSNSSNRALLPRSAAVSARAASSADSVSDSSSFVAESSDSVASNSSRVDANSALVSSRSAVAAAASPCIRS